MLMFQAFSEYHRLLKAGHWMTVEFHNSHNAVWNAIQEALSAAGFVVADVRTLDKQSRSYRQVTANTAAKQDLIISAYKPTKAFERKFHEQGGSAQGAWEFVRQHLDNLSLPNLTDGVIQPNPENVPKQSPGFSIQSENLNRLFALFFILFSHALKLPFY
jgi:hypothetical protein